MPPFLECARRHAQLTRLAKPVLARFVSEVTAQARGVAARPLVAHRVKGVLSTWVKARMRRCPVDAIDDLLGVRVVVDTVDECYAVLAALLERWTPVGDVEDYIREPKGSGYQSLHVVIRAGPDVRVEVQVRTRAMHQASENGRAAHSLYKRRQLAVAAEPAGGRAHDAPPALAWLEGTPLGPGHARSSDLVSRLRDSQRQSGTVARVVRALTGRHDGSAFPTGALSGALVALVGLLDTVSGFSLDLSVFYLLPISIATWQAGRRTGLGVACLSALAWWLANHVTAPLPVHPLLTLWNAVMHLAVYALVSWTLDALRGALEHQRELLLTDPLTGVLSARGFFEVTQAHMEQARRLGAALTVAFVDLDDFKRVNDELGHGPADELLRAWAQALGRSMRAGDLLARLGGDEFAILLPDTTAGQAREVLARLFSQLSDHAGRLAMPVTFSMGAVTFKVVPGTVDRMLREADVLMYEAKAQGKNRWLLAEASAGPGAGEAPAPQ